MTDIKLVLASSSPRRRELLGQLGLRPEVVPPEVDESLRHGERPEAYVERVARAKAAAVRRDGAVVVAADTTVDVDGEILVKPEDAAEAVAMLKRLSGREHRVHTAIAVAYRDDTVSGVETTRVWIRPLDELTIRDYIATGESMDKAGAYSIQGFGAAMVQKIEGDYYTVMGLGLGCLVELLRQVGIGYRFGELRRA